MQKWARHCKCLPNQKNMDIIFENQKYRIQKVPKFKTLCEPPWDDPA